MTTNQDQDNQDQTTKICSRCGVAYPLTTAYFPTMGRSKKTGRIQFRDDCRTCHNARAVELRQQRAEQNGGDKYRGAPKRPPWKLPAGMALGKRKDVPKCPEGEGLPVLTGPGGRPVVRERWPGQQRGETCIVLG